MPIIDAIEHGTYHDKAGDYLANNKGEHEKVLTPIKNFLKELKNGELDTIADTIGLDTESLIINKGSPLNQLTKNLQNDIDVFLEEIDPAFSEAFVKEVRTHRDKEATKSYDREKEWYEKERVKPLQRAIDDYNSGHRKSEYDEETGEYKVQYYKAHLMRTGSLLVDVTYSGGGNTDPRNDAKGRGLISAITAARDKAYNDYCTYVEPVEELKDKYAGTAETPNNPSILESIKDASKIWGHGSSESSSSSKTGSAKDFERPGYTIAAHLHDDSGDFILYKNDKDGKYYVFDRKTDEANQASIIIYNADGTSEEKPLTEELLKKYINSDKYTSNYIKVKTGADFGKHNFNISNEVDSMTSDDVKKMMANANEISKTKTINGETYTLSNMVLENEKEAGKYAVYKKDGKMYIEGQDGKMHKVRDVAGNRYKVQTGGALGDEHYKLSNDTAKILNDTEMNEFFKKTKVGTYNGNNIYIDNNNNAYIETFPGQYTPLTNNTGYGNAAHMIKNDDGSYKFEDTAGVKIDTGNIKTQDVALNLDNFESI